MRVDKICPVYNFILLVLKKLNNRNKIRLLPLSFVMEVLTGTIGKRFNYRKRGGNKVIFIFREYNYLPRRTKILN